MYFSTIDEDDVQMGEGQSGLNSSTSSSSDHPAVQRCEQRVAAWGHEWFCSDDS
ncbi:hypothetical protein CRENBAI_013443, partial [Crenichthys baileyi]